MLTVRVLPPALRTATSPCPLTKVTLRVPPPPQPSFFTRNCSLGERGAMSHRDRTLSCFVTSPVLRPYVSLKERHNLVWVSSS